MADKWRYAPHFDNGSFDDWGDGNGGFMNSNGSGAGSGHLAGGGTGHGSGDQDGDGEPMTYEGTPLLRIHRRFDDEVLGTYHPRGSTA